ncbi:hypothetical protein KIPB_014151, partial [Kipferlia bialata]
SDGDTPVTDEWTGFDYELLKILLHKVFTHYAFNESGNMSPNELWHSIRKKVVDCTGKTTSEISAMLDEQDAEIHVMI